MRRWLLLAVLALAWGCTASEKPAELQEIRVRVSGVTSGSIGTKSVQDALAGTLPSGSPTLTLRSTEVSSRVYTVHGSESVSVPVGVYEVSGGYEATSVGTAAGNKLYTEPSFSAAGEIEVVSGVDTYEVSGEYNCYAVAVDKTEVSKVTQYYTGASGYNELKSMKTVGDVAIIYVKVSYTEPWYLNIYPVDEANQEVRQYILSPKSGQSGTVFVETGRWYLLSPRDVEKQEGAIGVDLPGWSEGNTGE